MEYIKTDKFSTLTDILPYNAIANDLIISKKNTITAICEITVSTLNDEDTLEARHDRIMNLICDFPDDTVVSLYYCKYFSPHKIGCIGTHQNSIVNYLEGIRTRHLVSVVTSPTYQNFISITFPVVKKTKKTGVDLLDSFNKTEGENTFSEVNRKAIEKMATVINSFRGSLGGGVFRLNSSQIVQFLSLLINHHYMDNYSELSGVLTSDFNISYNRFTRSDIGGYVYYGGNYHAVMSLRSTGKESKLPEFTTARLNDIFHHKDLHHIPFTIQHTITLINKSDGIALAKKRKNRIAARTVASHKIAFLSKTPEGLPPEKLKELVEQSIEIVESSSNKFLVQHFHVHLWEDSLKKLDEKCENFNSIVSTSYKLKRDKYNIKGAFFSQFPGYEYINPITVVLPSYNIADFLPIDLPRTIYPDPKDKNFIYYHTKEDQLTKLDLFSRSADNWNALIIGGSGSGKSFLCNDLLWQYMVYDPQIAIVDYGGAEAGSYRNFVINNHGTYLEIDLDKSGFSVNPFDGQLFEIINDEEKLIAWKFTSLVATIERMLLSNSKQESLDGESFYLLQESLKEYYSINDNNRDKRCSLDGFAELLKIKALDLYKLLVMFIGVGKDEGPYARFFKSSKEIKSTDIICFDLAGLKGHQQLKNVLVPALLDMICTNILGDKIKANKRKLLIMDEAWQDLQGSGKMQDFMQEMSRTVRKLNGQITIISQRFADILDSTIGGALLANTSYFYFVGNKHDPAPLYRATASSSKGTMRLTDYDVTTIINSQSKRDFYLLTPFFSGLLKFYPTTEFAMVATTDPNDKAILRKYMKESGVNYVTPEVIERAKVEFCK